MAWSLSREDALVVVRDHINWLRKTGRFTVADALEHVLQKTPRNDDMAHFHVEGAGEIEIAHQLCRTGHAEGVHVGVSWGSWGYAGGVLDRSEAARMIHHIIRVIGD